MLELRAVVDKENPASGSLSGRKRVVSEYP